MPCCVLCFFGPGRKLRSGVDEKHSMKILTEWKAIYMYIFSKKKVKKNNKKLKIILKENLKKMAILSKLRAGS